MTVSSRNPAGSSLEAARFYEDYVEEHVPYKNSPRALKRFVLLWLPYWSYREWRFWDRYLPSDCSLLDLGSARGREVFRENGRRAVGIDLALNALTECSRNYVGATLGALHKLPFPDQHFDCAASSHVMGRIPIELKDAVFSEVHRVLRPGGRTLHIVECDSKHPWVELAKRSPELYKKYFIDPDGHVGLETASAVLARFARHGFDIEAFEPMDPGPWHPRHVVKWFDNEFRNLSAEIDDAVVQAKTVLESPLRLAIEEVRLGGAHEHDAWDLPLDHSQFVAVVAVKS